MLNRYIGNKKKILPSVVDAIAEHASAGDVVCDIFSGTLAVSFELKRRGFRVCSNDINLFSAMYGRAFLTNDGIPELSARELIPADHLSAATAAATDCGLDGTPCLDSDASEEDRRRFGELAAVIAYLNNSDASRLPSRFARSDFFDNYCEAGSKSAFTSSRGSTGRRRFFSAPNARRIDSVVGHLRYWHDAGLLRESARAVLTCQLLDAVERVSNTQGTYHDFPRAKYDPRSMGHMRLELPNYAGLVANRGPHILGVAQDSLEFIKVVPAHKVLYVDPPYNFRQYTAYYFMPNLIAAYPTIPDLDEYFSAIEFVRGQNMKDDFCSPFSRRAEFVPALQKLLAAARADTVVLSYYNGPNHWRDFKTGPAEGNGADPLERFFQSELFEPDSMRIKPVKRLNYQSYGGFSAEYIDELLIVANTRRGVGDCAESNNRLAAGSGRQSVRPVA